MTKANGELRLCGDYKITVNKHIQYDEYCLPLIDDLLARMTGCKVFSKFDLRKAYHQILLDDKSQVLTTITTPYGIFRYRSLPFGFKSAPSVFQQIMEEIFMGVEGVVVFQDDILLGTPDNETHFVLAKKVLEMLKSSNLKLNRDKSEAFTPKI